MEMDVLVQLLFTGEIVSQNLKLWRGLKCNVMMFYNYEMK